jgi:dTDP-glucose pyrophosphorylase
MKALVLAAGKGKRLENVTQSKNKCMINFNGEPIIADLLSDLSGVGSIEEIVIVVGYQAEEIINYFGTSYQGKKIKYVIQPELRGLVNAIECARSTIDGADFLLALGDEVMIKPNRQEFIHEFRNRDWFALLGAVWVDNKDLIKKTYTFISDDQKQVYRLIEKPRKPLNHLMGTGNVVFKNQIYDYIELTPIHPERGEKELPDLLQVLIDDGHKVGYGKICDQYENLNTVNDLQLMRELERELV